MVSLTLSHPCALDPGIPCRDDALRGLGWSSIVHANFYNGKFPTLLLSEASNCNFSSLGSFLMTISRLLAELRSWPVST